MVDPSSALSRPTRIYALAALLIVGAVVYGMGIVSDLPYVVQPDEVLFFGRPAAQMAATGQLNPGWFGHPASTFIYPLSGIYHLWHALAHQGSLLRPDSRLLTTFETHIGEFLFLGRLLSVMYGVATLGVFYRLGRRFFDESIALLGVALLIPVPHLVLFAQNVRPDTATLFYTLLALWAILRVWERPSFGRQFLAGLACGVAVSTKYTLGILAVMLALVDGGLLWQKRGIPPKGRLLLGMALGLASVAVGFALTTPFFILDFPKAWQDLRHELRSSHLGADGFPPWGNLAWYLGVALPGLLGWGRYLVALAGVAWGIRYGRGALRWFLLFPLFFLVGVSLSPLHWPRWAFPALPMLILGAAMAIFRGVHWLGERYDWSSSQVERIAMLVALGLCVFPLYKTVQLEVQRIRPSTMVLTRQWLDANLPTGAIIAREEYSFPWNGFSFPVIGGAALGEKPLEHYQSQGAMFVAVSSAIYERYYREPARYAAQITFYERLEREAELIYEAVPDRWQGGPTVRVYRLREGVSP